LDTAVRVLDADEHTHVMAVSRVYETAPVGGPEQGPYLNAVAVLETDRSPYELLELLRATEDGVRRGRHESWGARPLPPPPRAAGGPPPPWPASARSPGSSRWGSWRREQARLRAAARAGPGGPHGRPGGRGRRRRGGAG